MTIWQILLANSALTAVALAAIAFLSRSIIERWIEKSIKKYEAHLQREAIEHQTKFTRLHQDRADVITEFYKKLIQIEQDLKTYQFILSNKADIPKEKEEIFFVKIFDGCKDLRNYFNEKELYLPEDLCNKINIFLEVLGWANFDPTLLESNDHPMKEIILSSNKLPNTNIPQLRQELKQEFRRILDVVDL